VMEFVVALVSQSKLGYIFLPYLAKQVTENYYKIIDNILPENIDNVIDKWNFSAQAKEILTLINSYSDKALIKIFSKEKKISAVEFYENTDYNFFIEKIRPYIEKKLFNIANILRHSNIKVFDRPEKHHLLYLDDQIIVQKDIAQTIFNFHKEEDCSKYFLSIKYNLEEMKLKDESATIISFQPCSLLLKKKIYLFNDIDGKKLLPFFKKDYIVVSKQIEKEYFSSFVLNAVKNYNVKAKGFTILKPNPLRKVVLSLERDWKTNFVIIPEFWYNDKKYFCHSDIDTIVTLTEQGNTYCFSKFERNTEWENAQIEMLLNLGLVSIRTGMYGLPQMKEKETVDEFLMLNWVNKNYDELLQAGFEVVNKTHNDSPLFIQKTSVEKKITKKQDWFDIKGIVKFGEFEIPFLKLKPYILSKERKFVLPNGQIAILPLEWFSEFEFLFVAGEEIMGYIQLNKQHFTALEPLIEDISENDYKEILLSREEIAVANVELEPELTFSLRPYQQLGFAWLYGLHTKKLSGCLADDMGLGKTVQTLAFLYKVIKEQKIEIPSTTIPSVEKRTQKKVARQLTIFDVLEEKKPVKKSTPTMKRKPCLVVVPVSLIFNWENEIQKFVPALKTLRYTGNDRKKHLKNFFQYDIILTSYGIVRNDEIDFQKEDFLYIVLDESQYINNPESKIFQALVSLQSDYRLSLSGTPIQNSLTDLWSQFNFLNNKLFGKLQTFQSHFVIPIERQKNEKRQSMLQALINPYILRRTKEEVLTDLPEMTQQIVYCEMNTEQNKLYEEEKSKIRNRLISEETAEDRKANSFLILQAITRLRQIANHPLLIDKEWGNNSGKYQEVIREIDTLIAENHKVLIFSTFVKHLDIYEKYFQQKNIGYEKLIGSSTNRGEIVERFNNEANKKVFLISLKAGGVGLNLTSADYVFIIDPWWNPAAEDQAISRAHRIGQTQKVFVYRFISKDSIEEKILRLQQYKHTLANMFINSNNPAKLFDKDIINQLFE